MLQHRLVWATGQPLVGNFLRVGNDAIQSFEEYTRKSWNFNGRIFGASGLRVFDSRRGREKKAQERVEWGPERATGNRGEVRRLPQEPPRTNTRYSAIKKANRAWLAFMNWWRLAETNGRPRYIYYCLFLRFIRRNLSAVISKSNKSGVLRPEHEGPGPPAAVRRP